MPQIIGPMQISPSTDSIDPEVRIDCGLETRGFEMLVDVSGELLASDGKRVARLHTSAVRQTPLNQDLLADKYWEGNWRNQIRRCSWPLFGALSQKAIDLLDSLRDKNPRKDVELKVKIRAQVLMPAVTIAPKTDLPMPNLPTGTGGVFGFPADPNRWNGNRSTDYLLSADVSGRFLIMTEAPIEDSIRIPAADWRHDFAPAFGLGRFIVAEIPLEEEFTKDGKLSERLDRAVKATKALEAWMRQGEWGEVVKGAREVFELLRNDEINRELRGALDLSPESVEDLTKGLRGIFDFTSKLHHATDRAGALNPVMVADKEDAYLVYTTALTLLNLVVRKMRKAGRVQS